MSAVRRLTRNRASPAEAAAELDGISRKRPLSPAESLLLERSIRLLDRQPMPRGLTKELARAGVKRDMRQFAKPTA